MPIPVNEKTSLERCLLACKRQLDVWRAEGNEIRAALAEADMNGILDKLTELRDHDYPLP